MMGREEWFRPSNVLGKETDGPTSKERKVEGEKKVTSGTLILICIVVFGQM